MRKMFSSGKILLQQAVQCARRCAVVAERLLDHQTRVLGAARLRQRLRHGREQAWRHREIVQRPLRLTKLLAQLGEGRGIVVVAVDIAQQRHQPLLRLRVRAAVMLQAVCRACLQLIQVPPGLGDADDRHVQSLVAHQTQQRREDLLVGQIAGGAEKDDRVGRRCSVMIAFTPVFSTWPPNAKRIADSSRLA